MKQPKLDELIYASKETSEIRRRMVKVKKIKITINIDEDSLETLRNISEKSGAPYQKVLNQVLREGLNKRLESDSRLDRLERELEKIKRKVAA